MARVGIMHSGSQNVDGANVTALQNSLALAYNGKKGPLDYAGTPLYAIDLGQSLSTLADQLLNANPPVDILVAAGGSRCAVAAQTQRANTNTPDKPVILFTSVAPYVCNNLAPNMTGVCAHTSDHDVARLNWLTKMPLHGNKIGVLSNSDRGDGQKQINDLKHAAGTTWKLVPRDIKFDKKLKESFNWLHGDVRALLVAADPFFNENRSEVVDRANVENYPAIFQWREFVELGGLMSYGPNITKLYQQAGTMAAYILNNNAVPPVREPQDPVDFELVVKQSTAQNLNMWPLPQAVRAAPNLVVIP
jgi:putative tryptophan/tyrosine transport system substrate-binding protein